MQIVPQSSLFDIQREKLIFYCTSLILNLLELLFHEIYQILYVVLQNALLIHNHLCKVSQKLVSNHMLNVQP